MARVDRALYLEPPPEAVLVVVFDRGTPHACADRKQLEKFQQTLDIRENLKPLAGEDVVVQLAGLSFELVQTFSTLRWPSQSKAGQDLSIQFVDQKKSYRLI